MRPDEIPPPSYPEYPDLLVQAERNARGPVDPCSIPRKEDLIRRRGSDWCLAVLGKPCHGLAFISSVAAELLVLADAADIDPPLPQWVVDARAETARRKQARDDERAGRRKRDRDAWDEARKGCLVPLEVRLNPTARVRNGEWHNLGHAVPLVDARSPRRLHPKGRALCESLRRAKPLRLGDPATEPVTCVRCLAYVPQIRRADVPAGPDPDAVMVQSVLQLSGKPVTTELLVSAANAYAALRSSRERSEGEVR